MTEELLLEKVQAWADVHKIQFDKLSVNVEVTLANGQKTYAPNEATYACFSKKDETYKPIVFSYRSLIVFSYENSIITADEATVLEPAFIAPPAREELNHDSIKKFLKKAE